MSSPPSRPARRPAPARRPEPTARGVSLAALQEIERGGRANVVVPALLASSRLEARDRHLVTELVYGACRMQRACDWLTDRHLRGRVDDEVRGALRLGAYQLGWTRIPPHAAVSATVSEVRGPGRTVVNAVLRRVAADVERGSVTWPDAAVELSYPDWIVERLVTDLGEDRAFGALEVMNDPASATARPDGYIQDRGSQLIVEHLRRYAAGGSVLDLCAAPGGKATGLAGAADAEGSGADQHRAGAAGAAGAGSAVTDDAGARVAGAGEAMAPPRSVVAADVVASRARVVASNAARLGTTTVDTVIADGLEPPFRRESFGLVLVDAPCSGLGVLRRRPDARWRIRPGDVDRLVGLQRRLLSTAAGLVRPGGVLAFSVCTLTAAETAAIDNWLADTRPDWKPLPPPPGPWQPAGRGALLLPQTEGTDGMFLLTLRVS